MPEIKVKISSISLDRLNIPLFAVHFEMLTICYNYFDTKSLKISLNPARMAFVCSICLFCASRNISADPSYLALSSSILRSHISKNCHSGAMSPSLTSHFFLLTLLQLFSSVFLFSPMSVAVEGASSMELFIEISGTSATAVEVPLSLFANVALPSIAIFDGSTLSR